MRRLLMIGLLAVSGCQSDTDPMTTSAPPPELSPAASNAIAGDMASRFAEQVGNEQGTLVLKQNASPFGQALVAALKGWGYAIAIDQETDDRRRPSIQLVYTVDDFEGQTLARLSSGTVELARAYSTTADGASPASPLTVMRRQ
ncbi:conjugal transfer protein TrbH [Rhizobium giardinii]|uniref:ABC-type molybdate transport system substrate-binding protein n=1 Tax=Rhizobium giardinii TaxID=56731 RepID=A0A7W8UBH4_9HYPH|nr:conjugal transfer protein TrbH [Rhizobium giardinii]MBB5536324.1 ABC-type molybdate transport system substrate-binding protein [Rhizobium giardinii]